MIAINIKQDAIFIVRLIFALCLLLGFACSCQTSSDLQGREQVQINPRLPEEQIRAKILKFTPIGTSEHDVIEFARTQLKHGKAGPSQSAVNSVLVLLGRYGS